MECDEVILEDVNYKKFFALSAFDYKLVDLEQMLNHALIHKAFMVFPNDKTSTRRGLLLITPDYIIFATLRIAESEEYFQKDLDKFLRNF
ncbi:hypothetical protein WR25_09322 [Diploscapter pachys]|uniref:Uncharacterized protein n=1 Tax=Diploscapter pachys TaxID=2018661 RepID=A0A2A2L5J9_9BILA|nr:hypothetical protein WR25_09322 [Diploscapter pachys]